MYPEWFYVSSHHLALDYSNNLLTNHTFALDFTGYSQHDSQWSRWNGRSSHHTAESGKMHIIIEFDMISTGTLPQIPASFLWPYLRCLLILYFWSSIQSPLASGSLSDTQEEHWLLLLFSWNAVSQNTTMVHSLISGTLWRFNKCVFNDRNKLTNHIPTWLCISSSKRSHNSSSIGQQASVHILSTYSDVKQGCRE